MESRPRKLLEQVRDAIRIKQYSYSTKKTYVHWAKRNILFHKAKQGFARHPAEMGAPEIEAFLSHLTKKPMSRRPPKTRLSMPCFFYIDMCST